MSRGCSSAGRLTERGGRSAEGGAWTGGPLEAKVVESLLCVGNDRQSVSPQGGFEAHMVSGKAGEACKV